MAERSKDVAAQLTLVRSDREVDRAAPAENALSSLEVLGQRVQLTQGEDRTVLDRPNERYHAYRTTQSRRPRPEPAPDLLARSPDSMRQDFSLGGSFKIFGTTILSPFQCIRNTPNPGGLQLAFLGGTKALLVT